jgi:hypothetical protein
MMRFAGRAVVLLLDVSLCFTVLAVLWLARRRR